MITTIRSAECDAPPHPSRNRGRATLHPAYSTFHGLREVRSLNAAYLNKQPGNHKANDEIRLLETGKLNKVTSSIDLNAHFVESNLRAYSLKYEMQLFAPLETMVKPPVMFFFTDVGSTPIS